MKNKDKIYNLILPVISIASILIIWAVTATVVGSEYIFPSVSKTFSEIISLLSEKEFYLAFLSTLFRSLVSFVVSFIIAFILAVLSVQKKNAEKMISPFISVLRALPTIAVVLLLLFWTNSKIAPVIVTMLVVLPTAYSHVKSAFEAVDRTTIEAGQVDGADVKQDFIKIQLPQALPAVYTAVGGGLSLNLKLMVAAEVIAATANSIGYLLNTSKAYFEISNMMAIVVLTVIVGCLIEGAFNVLSKKTGEWK